MINKLSISQNFLSNRQLVSKLIKVANLAKDNLIIDIGVGKGIISQELLNNGYFVRGYELDENLYQTLTQIFKNSENIEILNKDFLIENLQSLPEFSVFSNIPYNLTTKISQKLLIENPYANKVCLIVQEESAKRLQGISEGLLISILIFNNYESKIIYKFKKNDFTPKPRVNSVLIEFTKRKQSLISQNNFSNFLDFICFIVMQQKPTLNERLSQLLSPSQKTSLFNLLKIDGNSSLYQIDKLKYFEMYESVMKNFPNQIKIIKGSYQKYQEINNKNQKVFRTRLR